MNASVFLPILIATCALSCTLGACATEPVEVPVPQQTPPTDTNVYFYPSQGRSIPNEQQDRDKYECDSWAVQQTGFDPGAPGVPPHQRMQIFDQAPSSGAVVGLAGAAVGGSVAAEHDEELNRLKAHADLSEAQAAVMETEASEFRRALSACLDARGYSVKVK